MEDKKKESRQEDAPAGHQLDPELTPSEREYDLEHRDWALQMIVGFCDLSSVEIPITLNVGGAYVSGYITRSDSFFDGVISELETANYQGPSPADVKELMKTVFTSLRDLVTAEVDEEGARKRRPRQYRGRYIHLRAARFFSASGVQNPFPALPKGTWWRGKIDAVDGFFIGMPFPK